MPNGSRNSRTTLILALLSSAGLAFAAGPMPIAESAPDVPSVIRLLAGEFDPLVDPIPGSAKIDAQSGTLAIIQLAGPTTATTHEQLQQLGATGLRYLPDGAFVAQVDPAARQALANSELVRWLGDYKPSYRLPPELLAQLQHGAAQPQRYNILLRERGAVQQGLGARIKALGGALDTDTPQGRVFVATLDGDQLAAIIRDDDVLFVDPWSEPQSDMNNARELSGADYVEAMAGYTGEGVRGEAFDGGLRTSHQDFQSDPPILHTNVAGSLFHGTSVFGIVFGDGLGDARARGVMPDAQGIFADNGQFTDRFAHTAELLEPPYEAVFQTNSWGFQRTRNYTNASAEMDDIIFQLDFTILQSQSNAGNQDSRPQAWAKNIVSVGGVRHNDTASTGDDAWFYGGSTGPALEGRVKPDLTHFYDLTLTTDASSDTSYANFGGTSGATPITAGFFGLMFQMWSDGIFGNDVSGGTVFEERPHASTAKALMINSASAYQFDGAWSDFSRYRQGWGLADVRTLFDDRDATFVVDEADPIEIGQTNSYSLEVLPGEDSLRATMVFHDPPGNPASLIAAVNDLSLRATSPEGETYWGNVGLLDEAFSIPGGSPNTIDTVENIFIQNPAAGVWTIDVVASAINEDGRPESPELDADYALVVAGVLASPRSDIVIRFPDGQPSTIDAGRITPIEVDVITPTTPTEARLHALDDQGNERTFALTLASVDGDVHSYSGALPPAFCDEGSLSFWIETDVDTTTWTLPSLAPQSVFSASVISERVILDENFDDQGDWTVENETGDGFWEWGEPRFGGTRNDPPTDFDGNDLCFLTGNGRVGHDVDLGPTHLISPSLDLSGTEDPVITFAAWVMNNDAGHSGEDSLLIDVSFDNGTSWTQLGEIRTNWRWHEYTLHLADAGTPTATTRVRFSASDNPNDSFMECAIDAVEVADRFCDTCPGDLDADNDLDADDFFIYLDLFASGDLAADLTGDGQLDSEDFFSYLDIFARGCQ